MGFPQFGEGSTLVLTSINRLMNLPLFIKKPRRTARQALRFIEVDI